MKKRTIVTLSGLLLLILAVAGWQVNQQLQLIGGIDSVGAQHSLRTDTSGGLILSSGSTASDGLSNSNITFPLNSNGVNNPSVITQLLFNGSTWDRALYCPNTATFSVASTITEIVPLSGAKKVRICSFSLNPSTSTAGSVDIVYGTGSNCGTGTTTLTGAYTLPASAVVNAAMFNGGSPSGALTTPGGQAACVRTVTATVNGFITWEQH